MLKQRRLVVMAFVLVAVLALGIGYAAVSTTLDFMGTASVSTSATENVLNNDIVFTSAEAVASNSGTTSTAILAMSNKRVSFEAKDFTAVNDTVTIIGNIKNNGSAGYNVSITPRLVAPAGNANEYFDVTYSFDTDVDNAVINAGADRDYKVVIKLKKLPVDTTVTVTVTLELTATTI
ncbi:MAG: hypothetical protein IJF76_01485 [Clostridia bacterium]|nr:hypothetical protein [Clostridia bacterium]